MNKPLPSAGKSSTGRSGLPWAVGALITLVVLTLIVMIFGSVSGVEFDPWRFRRQQYRFMQIPILRWQVRPTRYNDITSPTEIAIAAIIGAPPIPAFTVEGGDEGEEGADDSTKDSGNNAAKSNSPSSTSSPSRWDLVQTRRAGAEAWTGDAKILCDALDTRDHQRDAFWESWTTKHPAAAKVLWPAVARTAQAELYVLIPDLLDIAANHIDAKGNVKDVKRLSAMLDRVVETQSLQLADALLAAEKREQALQAYELVLKVQPDSKTAANGVVSAKAAIETAQAAEAATEFEADKPDQKQHQGAAPVTAEVESEFAVESAVNSAGSTSSTGGP